MGEVDQVIAEPDGLLEEEGESVEGLHPHHLNHQDPRLVTPIYHTDPDALMAKRIDKARQRMQEQYNIAAAVSLQKKKEMEEKMKESKIAKFEQQQAEGGARGLASQDKSSSSSATVNASTSRGATVNASTSRGAKRKSGAKQKLRPEYNPLIGDVGGGGGGCRWKPSGRGPSGGG